MLDLPLSPYDLAECRGDEGIAERCTTCDRGIYEENLLYCTACGYPICEDCDMDFGHLCQMCDEERGGEDA